MKNCEKITKRKSHLEGTTWEERSKKDKANKPNRNNGKRYLGEHLWHKGEE